jgi:hypothetical protein
MNRNFKFLALAMAITLLSAYAFAISPPINARSPLKMSIPSIVTKHQALQKERFQQVPIFATNNHGGEVEGGDSSMATSTFNLAKSIIGAGVLSLPNGVAFFSSDPKALIPSSIICVVFGLVAAYSFSSIGKVCKETKSKSFQEAWGNTVDRRSAWTITASITAMCFLASLAYSIIIGDSFASLAKVDIFISSLKDCSILRLYFFHRLSMSLLSLLKETV